MAQNITLLGASYSDVPAVTLPKTGSGIALFSDPSITTAVASDVAQGKQFLLADGSIGTGTASGGGGGSENETGTFSVAFDTLVSNHAVSFLNAHSSVPRLLQITDADIETFPTGNQNDAFINFIMSYGDTSYSHKTNLTSAYYGVGGMFVAYRAKNSGSLSNTYITFRYPETVPLNSLTSTNRKYSPLYYADANGFKLLNMTSQYFLSGRTYKWRALWG